VSADNWIAVMGLAVLAGCGAAPHTRAAGAVAPMSVRAVAWNPARAQVGRVTAVADAGSVVAVFGDGGATVFSSGAVVASDRNVGDWVDAGTIRGADGTPRWIVGIDGKGHLYYLRAMSSFEDVSTRYGLEGQRVLAAAMLDKANVGFLLDREVAVADGRRSTQYGYPGNAPWTSLAGGGGWGAGVSRDAVTLFDTARFVTRTYALPGVTRAAMTSDGRLYAATSRAVYAGSPSGELLLVYDAERDTIHGLVASGDRVWFADGSELGLVEGDHVFETGGANIAPDAKLASSPSRDVWVLGGGGLQRLTRAEPEQAATMTWSLTLGPIFARDCATCHLPDGVSGTDLSSAAAWQSERAAIDERVVVRRSMPPEGHPIPEADRDAIRAWAEATP
jgi:mono/diheme cytochrome c family protein